MDLDPRPATRDPRHAMPINMYYIPDKIKQKQETANSKEQQTSPFSSISVISTSHNIFKTEEDHGYSHIILSTAAAVDCL